MFASTFGEPEKGTEVESGLNDILARFGYKRVLEYM